MSVVGSINSFFARIITRIVDRFYIAPIDRFIPHHTFKYLACGVGNYFLLDSLLYFVLYNYIVAHRYLDCGFMVVSPHILSMIILFPITFFTGFWLNRYVAFDATREQAKVQIVRYGATIVGSLVISYLVLKFMVEYVGLWPTPAKVCTSVVTATYSYLAARYFTFRR